MKNLKNKFILLGVGTLMAFSAMTIYQENLTAQVIEIPCEEYKYAFNRDILDCEGGGDFMQKTWSIKFNSTIHYTF